MTTHDNRAALAVCSSFAGSAKRSIISSDPAQAFTAIQSGVFRIGARVQGSAVTGTITQYSVDDLTVCVAGYPIKALFQESAKVSS